MNVLHHQITITGTVQGVGFRPFVYRLATQVGVRGSVRNTAAGVVIDIVGSPEQLAEFAARLPREAPPLSRITSLTVHTLPPIDAAGFTIIESAPGPRPTALIPPDVALCADCARELADPTDRRYRYPFTNCTNCGPRFSIVTGIPYDRSQTTMAVFTMCEECAAEYGDPTDRRFHAEPVACPKCGPALLLDGTVNRDALAAVAAWLQAGKAIALKGLGGYHLACDARNPIAVETLRRRKGRGEKPFAIMVRNLEEARLVAEVSERAAALLTSPESPVVIMPAREAGGLAAGIAPRQKTVGVMLPYTPMHRLLLDLSPSALVMTSGNLAEEPIVHTDDAAEKKLGALADHLLSHQREIAVACDDSVVRVTGELVIPIRRARGYIPRAVSVEVTGPTVLAVGGYHKDTFCLLHEGQAILSQHIGDLDILEVMEYFDRAVAHFMRLFRAQPEVIAHDLHPGYLSTQYALNYAQANAYPAIAVQHHHAHVVSVMAEAGVTGPVIGISYDGTGYGTDGTVWGGEILLADRMDFTRVGHLRPVPMPGGEAAILHPARMALSHLLSAYDAAEATQVAEELLPSLTARERTLLAQQIARGLNSPLTSSMGRLFDAVGVLLGASTAVSYEGQPAMELEAMAEGLEASAKVYPYNIAEGVIDPRPMWRGLVADLRAGTPQAEAAVRFHETVAAFTVEACVRLREHGAPHEVALSGGVMQNARLVKRLVERLTAEGFTPLLHKEVPPNDGGLSLGQAVVAVCRTK